MWIKTVGGYLLNTDKLTFIYYEPDKNYTRGYDGEVHHIISEGNTLDIIFSSFYRDSNVLEVR